MQQRLSANLPSLRHPQNPAVPDRKTRSAPALPALLAAVVLAAAAGCGGEPGPGPAAKTAPFAGVALKLRCPDEAFRAAITHPAQNWASRTGASLTLVTRPAGDDVDIDVLPVGEFGSWADRGELVPVPASLRAADNPFQWNGLLPAYRERLIEWGGQARALPLGGEGLVIVYRNDRLAEEKLVAAFARRTGAKPGVPATWEDFADLAAAFAEVDGRPSLPAMTPAEVADLYFRVAACYDRPSLTDTALAAQGGARQAFQHDARTGAPRLDAAGFSAAADWLAGLAKCFPTDPAADLGGERGAALGVLSLAQLAKLRGAGGEVPARYGIAPLPGTRSYADETTGQLVRGGAANYVPYFSRGWLGAVRTRCANAEAAFDLLAELGGPTRSQELVSNPALGVGPFRSAHLEQDQLLVWLGYGLDAGRSRALQSALQRNNRTDVRNPAYGLRGPDARELDAAAAAELARVAAGAVPGDVGLKNLRAAWDRIDQKTPADTRSRWRRLAAGQN